MAADRGHEKASVYCLPNSRVMTIKPLAVPGIDPGDPHPHQGILDIKKRMNELMAKHTGKSLEVIERETDRDHFLSAAEAVEFGLSIRCLERMPRAANGGLKKLSGCSKSERATEDRDRGQKTSSSPLFLSSVALLPPGRLQEPQ